MRRAKITAIFAVITIFAISTQLIGVEKLGKVEELEIKSFSSPEEFRDYVSKGYYGFSTGIFDRTRILSPSSQEKLPSPEATMRDAEIERFSTTNVQVFGIDEPDIVKTDGEKLYISRFKAHPTIKILPPHPYYAKTIVLKAFPPNEIEKLAELDFSGDLLLYSDVLILLRGDQLRGIDTKSFGEKYGIELNGTLVTARIYDGKIYTIVSQYPENCPIVPLKVNGENFVVECSGIYHPIKPIPVESVYTVVKIDAKTGKVEKAISFVGNP
ncbi:MAG: beta-propeller domain-containing protein, partial [Archaeoglobaceae archaeon]